MGLEDLEGVPCQGSSGKGIRDVVPLEGCLGSKSQRAEQSQRRGWEEGRDCESAGAGSKGQVWRSLFTSESGVDGACRPSEDSRSSGNWTVGLLDTRL